MRDRMRDFLAQRVQRIRNLDRTEMVMAPLRRLECLVGTGSHRSLIGGSGTRISLHATRAVTHRAAQFTRSTPSVVPSTPTNRTFPPPGTSPTPLMRH